MNINSREPDRTLRLVIPLATRAGWIMAFATATLGTRGLAAEAPASAAPGATKPPAATVSSARPKVEPAQAALIDDETGAVPPIRGLRLYPQVYLYEPGPVAHPHASENGRVSGRDASSVVVYGTYIRPGWKLSYGNAPVALNRAGGFALAMRPSSVSTRAILVARGPNGPTERQEFEVRIPEWSPGEGVVSRAPPRPPAVPKKLRTTLKFGLGISSINYAQTFATQVTGNALTAKASLQHRFAEHWDIGVGGYGTVLPFGLTPSAANLRFFGVNIRLGYTVPFVRPPWFFGIYPGIYYTSTSSSPAYNVGYLGLAGPQLTPVLQRSFDGGGALGAYFKFAPVSNTASLSFADRELAYGLFYNFAPSLSGRYFSLGLDVSELRAQVDTVAIDSKSVSLGLTYAW